MFWFVVVLVFIFSSRVLFFLIYSYVQKIETDKVDILIIILCSHTIQIFVHFYLQIKLELNAAIFLWFILSACR